MMAVIGTYRTYRQFLRDNPGIVGRACHVVDYRTGVRHDWTAVILLDDAYLILRTYPTLALDISGRPSKLKGMPS